MFSLSPRQVRWLLGAVNVRAPFGRRDYLLILFLSQTGLRLRATPYTLRHSFASQLLASGGSLVSAQKILGHRRIASTQIYSHASLEQMKKDAAMLGG